jgi:phospholipase C
MPSPIKHVVVLMLENRSFDHMLGFMRSASYKIEGLTGQEFNRLNPATNKSAGVPVSDDAEYEGDLNVDPTHDVGSVCLQIYGAPSPPPPPVKRSMIGFVYSYLQRPGMSPTRARNIMKCFAPSKVGALTTLAKQFAVCDHWFASVPGPTWPNRFFAHCASSGGYIDNEVRHYGMKTIFEQLTAAGRDWRVYFHDIPQCLTLSRLQSVHYVDNFQRFKTFLEDAALGTLPAYSFIEPRYFDFLHWKANDEHPPHNVGFGEMLIADVYEALRKSPLWNTSLLLILFDEHGGTYDHLLPPSAVPPGDDASQGFAFDRLGVRVPAVVVSPLIPAKTIDSRCYDHTSIPATVRALLLPDASPNKHQPLTKRDAAAQTFDDLLSLSKPRIDTPEKLPRPAGEQYQLAHAPMTVDIVRAAVESGEVSVEQISEVQTKLVDFATSLDIPEPARLRVLREATVTDTEHDAAVHVQKAVTRFLGVP